MKTVLITGATGFIGSFLIQEFIKNHKVLCLVRPGTTNLNRISEFFDDIIIHEHDIRQSLLPIADIVGPVDIILHAGGNPSAADSRLNPMSVITDNVIGTANLLEFARIQKLERFVYYSSGEVFGPIEVGKDSKETDVYNCQSPYAASKAAGEELCIAYSNSYNMPMSIIHINNTFGPKCQNNRLPVIILNNIMNKKELIIHANHDGTVSGRRWFHAEDVANHTLFILNNQIKLCEKWNSAGNKFIDNLEFAQTFSQCFNSKLKYKIETINNPDHKLCFSIDPSKLYSLGYSDLFSLEQRVQQTVDWYSKNPDWLK